MTNEPKAPKDNARESQEITSQTGEVAKSAELDAEQLDKVAGGTGGLHHGGPVGPGPGG